MVILTELYQSQKHLHGIKTSLQKKIMQSIKIASTWTCCIHNEQLFNYIYISKINAQFDPGKVVAENAVDTTSVLQQHADDESDEDDVVRFGSSRAVRQADGDATPHAEGGWRYHVSPPLASSTSPLADGPLETIPKNRWRGSRDGSAGHLGRGGKIVRVTRIEKLIETLSSVPAVTS